MPAVPGATQLLALPASGRRFSGSRIVRLGDVAPSGRLRLDATARYLQDVAEDDAADSGLDPALGWVVRRSMIEVGRPASHGERVELTTFCTGLGRSWAERTTRLRGSDGAVVDAVSLWVQVVAATGRPTPISDHFREIYGPSSNGRVVSARLVLPAPAAATAERRPWTVRRTDLDLFDHVNNAATWDFLEEVLDANGGDGSGCAEMEYAVPLQHGASIELWVDRPGSSSCSAWLVADPAVHSAARWSAAPSTMRH